MVPSQTETDADGDQVSQPVDSRPSLEDVQRLGTRRPRGDWTAHAAERHDAEELGLCIALMVLVFFLTWKLLCWAIILIIWVTGWVLDLLG